MRLDLPELNFAEISERDTYPGATLTRNTGCNDHLEQEVT
jgi:hypothetical protein